MSKREAARACAVVAVLFSFLGISGSPRAIGAQQADPTVVLPAPDGDEPDAPPDSKSLPREPGDAASADSQMEDVLDPDELAQSQDPSRRQSTPRARPQPPVTTPVQPRTVPPRAAATAPAISSPRFYRLASVPEMFGDFFGGGSITTAIAIPAGTGTATLPTAGGARRSKIAENNKPFPQDRVFFMYNHFHNALETELTGSLLGAGPAPDDFSVDRYTFGFEKTFCEGTWSAELRVPFTGRFAEETTGFEVDGGKWGNLSVVLKRLLYASECAAVAGGMAIDFPTGSDVDGTIGADSFSLDNDAYHLMPYVGFMSLPDDRAFVQGFVQLDVPLNGNRVEVVPAAGSGRLDEQTLLFFDISGGYWVYRNDCGSGLTGLAPIVELHYTTTLEDTDSVAFATGAATYDFANAANRLDVLNLTLGLHAQFGQGLNVRVGAVFPLRNDDDKIFDAELQVSVNWRY